MTRKPAKPRAVWCCVNGQGIAVLTYIRFADARLAHDNGIDRIVKYIPAPARPARRRKVRR